MIRFVEVFSDLKIVQTLTGQLGWSHFVQIIALDDPLKRDFYAEMCRIIHSNAYSRYIDKTQVFFLVDNDHITHRVLHVQLVSKIAISAFRFWMGFSATTARCTIKVLNPLEMRTGRLLSQRWKILKIMEGMMFSLLPWRAAWYDLLTPLHIWEGI